MAQEKLTPHSNEALTPNSNAAERMQELAEKFDEALEHGETSDSETIEKARKDVEQYSTKGETASKASEKPNDTPNQTIRTKADRIQAYRETLIMAQSRLKSRERTFSKVIHNQTVESISEATSKSVGRSSVLLGGFATTFIGSLIFYYVTKRNGYHIDNYSFIIVLFAAGALLGLFIELIMGLIKKHTSR